MTEEEYWEDILDEANETNNTNLAEEAMKHLELLYPNTEDTALLDSDDEGDNNYS